MNLRPYLSDNRPPINAPIAAPKAFALKAPNNPTEKLLKPKCSVHKVNPLAPATIQPESK